MMILYQSLKVKVLVLLTWGGYFYGRGYFAGNFCPVFLNSDPNLIETQKLTPNLTQTLFLTLKKVNENCADKYSFQIFVLFFTWKCSVKKLLSIFIAVRLKGFTKQVKLIIIIWDVLTLAGQSF